MGGAAPDVRDARRDLDLRCSSHSPTGHRDVSTRDEQGSDPQIAWRTTHRQAGPLSKPPIRALGGRDGALLHMADMTEADESIRLGVRRLINKSFARRNYILGDRVKVARV